MSRTLLAATVLLTVPLAVSAQRGGHAAGGVGRSGFGGGFRPTTPPLLPSMSTLPAVGIPIAGMSGGIGTSGRSGLAHRTVGLPFFGGYYPYGYGYGYGGFGYGYGFGGVGGFGYGSSSFYSPPTIQVPVYVPVGPSQPDVQLSDMATRNWFSNSRPRLKSGWMGKRARATRKPNGPLPRRQRCLARAIHST